MKWFMSFLARLCESFAAAADPDPTGLSRTQTSSKNE